MVCMQVHIVLVRMCLVACCISSKRNLTHVCVQENVPSNYGISRSDNLEMKP